MISTTRVKKRRPLPKSFDQLVRMAPPMAIRDDVQHSNVLEIIDDLMRIDALTRGQSDYLETMVELVAPALFMD